MLKLTFIGDTKDFVVSSVLKDEHYDSRSLYFHESSSANIHLLIDPSLGFAANKLQVERWERVGATLSRFDVTLNLIPFTPGCDYLSLPRSWSKLWTDHKWSRSAICRLRDDRGPQTRFLWLACSYLRHQDAYTLLLKHVPAFADDVHEWSIIDGEDSFPMSSTPEEVVSAAIDVWKRAKAARSYRYSYYSKRVALAALDLLRAYCLVDFDSLWFNLWDLYDAVTWLNRAGFDYNRFYPIWVSHLRESSLGYCSWICGHSLLKRVQQMAIDCDEGVRLDPATSPG